MQRAPCCVMGVFSLVPGARFCMDFTYADQGVLFFAVFRDSAGFGGFRFGSSSPLSPSSSPFLLLGSAWVCFFSFPPLPAGLPWPPQAGPALHSDMTCLSPSLFFFSLCPGRLPSPSLASLPLSLSLSLSSLSLSCMHALIQTYPQYCWEFHDRF